jgi:hypothetical protein
MLFELRLDGHGHRGICEVHTIMKVWQNLRSRSKYWSFVRFVESEVNFHEQLMEATNGVFTALWPVVQPLSVTLEMAAMSREFLFLKLDIPVPMSTWHLREVEVPAHVPVNARVKELGKHREEAVPELTPHVLADWLERAHAQQLPEEGYVPVLDTLHVYYTRARLLEDQEPSVQLAFGPHTYTLPVEQRKDGLWVAGPMRGTRINPPISWKLVNTDGRLGLEIEMGWSAWVATGSAEAELFMRCLHELEQQGWEED